MAAAEQLFGSRLRGLGTSRCLTAWRRHTTVAAELRRKLRWTIRRLEAHSTVWAFGRWQSMVQEGLRQLVLLRKVRLRLTRLEELKCFQRWTDHCERARVFRRVARRLLNLVLARSFGAWSAETRRQAAVAQQAVQAQQAAETAAVRSVLAEKAEDEKLRETRLVLRKHAAAASRLQKCLASGLRRCFLTWCAYLSEMPTLPSRTVGSGHHQKTLRCIMRQ